MRVLITTRGSAGHVLPLAPFGHALQRAGHDVLVAAQRRNEHSITRTGLPFAPVDDPPPDRWTALVPHPLEDPASPAPASTHRFAPAPPLPAAPLPDWWPGNDDPLVYMTFGSVAAAGHLPYYPALYRAAIDALAPLPVRILLTIGDARDHEELGPLPANVHIERCVDQDDVAPHAAAIVGHGGYGTTLGALRHGTPLVVVPLFSADQWFNAGAVARCGAGLALDAERHTRRVMALPGDDAIAGLRDAVARVIGEPSFAREAQRVAAAMDEVAPVDAAVDVLAAIAAAPLSAR